MDDVEEPAGVEVEDIEGGEEGLAGTSMSQVVDRFVFDKIQFNKYANPA